VTGGAAVAHNEHVRRLKQGIGVWNTWRARVPTLGVLDLRDANLNSTNLSGANLSGAILRDAVLDGANLGSAQLFGTDLRGAALHGAHLGSAVLSGAILRDADLTNATLIETILANLDLTSVIGLETCRHYGPSIIDHRTLQNSSPLPLAFLRGVGLPDNFVEYLPSLLNQAIQYYSSFISYSTMDEDFAKRLHADLQNEGVRCWFAPKDIRIGDELLETIYEAIRLRDKVLLILSEHSITSRWVKDEITKAFDEESRRGQTVLFPVRLDDAVMETNEAWAVKLRARHIGDFRRWKDHDAYKNSVEVVVRDLAATLAQKPTLIR
jgi:uncharacterized protein YjbI with pentapeptide repeats